LLPDSATIRKAARDAASHVAGRPINDTQRLISSGLIDSLSILRLICALEKKLKVCIPPANLQPDDFETIEWIVDTVERAAVFQ